MKLIDVETQHTAPFKVLFEVLKDMLIETNIEFRSSNKKNKKKKEDDETEGDPNTELEDDTEMEDCENEDKKDDKEEKDCMKITAIDPTKSVLINLKLEGVKFDKFVCKKRKFNVGVNLLCFYKLIKNMGKNDILNLSVDHNEKNYLKIRIDSADVKKHSEQNLKLLDLDENKMSIPDMTFDAVITMDSQEFNKLCREINNLANYVEIKCLKDKIIFTYKGEFADGKITYKTANAAAEDDESESILVSINHASTSPDKNAPEIVQGIFELKNLVLFSKCASLCNEIEIYMKNDFPLVIKYTVASLGRLLLCLTPIKEDTTKNANYSSEEEFYSDED